MPKRKSEVNCLTLRIDTQHYIHSRRRASSRHLMFSWHAVTTQVAPSGIHWCWSMRCGRCSPTCTRWFRRPPFTLLPLFVPTSSTDERKRRDGVVRSANAKVSDRLCMQYVRRGRVTSNQPIRLSRYSTATVAIGRNVIIRHDGNGRAGRGLSVRTPAIIIDFSALLFRHCDPSPLKPGLPRQKAGERFFRREVSPCLRS